MNERLKQIRANMKINQSEFAKLLGIGQSTLGMLEVGKREILDRHIKTICSLCNVNEHWFRTGQGSMYVENDETILLKLSNEYKLNKTEQRILKTYLNLDESRRNQLIDFVQHFAVELLNDPESIQQQSATKDIFSTTEYTIDTVDTFVCNKSKMLTNKEIENEVSNYRNELKAEQKGLLALQNLEEEKKA